MDLYLLRHAIAEERDASKAELDAQRRLTKEGRGKMKRVAVGMKGEKVRFDLILSSPYLRCKETAEIVANIFGAEKKLKFSEALKPEGSPKELIEALRGEYRKCRRVLLVGHEPYLSRLMSLLITGDTRAGIDLKKGGLGKLSIGRLTFGNCARREWLLQPGQTRRLAGN